MSDTMKASPGTDEWRALRANRVGASEVAALFGEDPFKDMAEVWAEKKGLIPPVTVTDAMRRGQLFEVPIATLWSEMEQQPVEAHQDSIVCGPLVATLDFVTPEGLPVEIKTSSTGRQPYWDYQVQTQMMALDAPEAFLVWLDQDTLLPVHETVKALPEMQEAIWQTAEHFVEAILPLDRWPETLSYDLFLRVVQADPDAPAIELKADEYELVVMLDRLRKTRSECEAMEKEIKEQLGRLLGESTRATWNGVEVLSFKRDRDGHSFDEKGFRVAHSALAAEWTGRKQGARKLMVTDPTLKVVKAKK